LLCGVPPFWAGKLHHHHQNATLVFLSKWLKPCPLSSCKKFATFLLLEWIFSVEFRLWLVQKLRKGLRTPLSVVK
jgi:hypothetical protein